ncbi:MAG TPA: TlpA disulfide reductase family protein [Bryobacteraceae bacterium]|nr:TlpA disulfide reductase family protein [Bryobacteraceae bacterium]
MKIWILLILATAALAQQPPAAAPSPKTPSGAEQKDLMQAVSEASNSTVDLVRVLESYLKKYPETVQRPEIELAIAKASIENRDDARIVQYGERVLAKTPDNVLLLDRVSQSLLALGGTENANKALKYSRSFEDIISGMAPPTGSTAPQVQEDRDRALGRTLLVQSRARAVLGDNENAERLAARAFSAYAGEETAREWAESLVRLGKQQEAITHLAEAFAIPDAHATDANRLKDRTRMGELYSKLHGGSEKGLGDLILAAYDRTSSLVEVRHNKLLSLDPNSGAAGPGQFTITAVDGKKLQMSSLAGKVVVLDFWATWCVPCRAQHPLYEQVAKHFADRKDLVFLALNTDEDHTLVQPFLKDQKWNNAVYFEDGMARFLNVDQIPTTILLDKSGKIASRMNGFLPDQFVHQLTERIDAALADSSKPAP